jgi:hypothetical protein
MRYPAAVPATRLFLSHHSVHGSYVCELFCAPGQPDLGRIESLCVDAQALRGIALGIERNERHSHALGGVPRRTRTCDSSTSVVGQTSGQKVYQS